MMLIPLSANKPPFSHIWLKVQMSDPAFSELSPKDSGVRWAQNVVFYLAFLKKLDHLRQMIKNLFP